MADDKKGRNKQADDEENRQRKRDMKEARNRADELEPMDTESTEQLGTLDAALDDHDYPTTTEELVSAYGDHEVDTRSGTKTVGDVLSGTDDETYESADDVRNRIQGLIHR